MEIDSCLVDTNILLRMTRQSDPQYKIVSNSLAALIGQSANLYYTHQNIAELWNAMTRAVDRNGLGLSLQEAEQEVQVIEAGMSLLTDGEAVYREWRRIVTQFGIAGVHVHDARLAAAMYVHRIGHILTLNVTDFSRFPGIIALHPKSV